MWVRLSAIHGFEAGQPGRPAMGADHRVAHACDHSLQGRVGDDEGRGFHDDVPWKTGLGEQRERTVNSLYTPVNPRRQSFSNRPPEPRTPLTQPTLIRRQNVLALFRAHAESSLTRGESPKGMEQAFAAVLQVSPSMWSQIKSSRPIGDKLARQIEQLCGKPSGWLDEERPAEGLTPVEQQFLALALKAWRSSNSGGRKALKAHLKQLMG